jgi:hypothetical protein
MTKDNQYWDGATVVVTPKGAVTTINVVAGTTLHWNGVSWSPYHPDDKITIVEKEDKK